MMLHRLLGRVEVSVDPKGHEVLRKLKVLRYSEETGHVGRTCRQFGIGRVSFNRRNRPP